MSGRNVLSPITLNGELCQVLSCLPEKFVVDFANGIDVARDHIRVQNDHTGLFSRLYDGFTGQGGRRQTEINASLADGVEGALIWLTELTESFAWSNVALAKVNERIASIQIAITQLSNYSADTRSQIEHLSESLSSKIDRLSAELSRVATEQSVGQQLDRVFNKWAAGRFATFSCAGRCYAALEELRWGPFGAYCRDAADARVRQNFLDDLANRVIKQLMEDMRIGDAAVRIPVDSWLTQTSVRDAIPDASAALAYLGDWSTPDLHPFAFTISQRPPEQPIGLPRLCSAGRVGQTIVSEIFEQE